MKADIGLIGLAVMGENLAMNMESKGFTVSVFNRDLTKVDNFLDGRANGKNFIGTRSVKELIDSLKSPRIIFMMVKAGAAVDSLIEQILPLLDNGDILIDGGNSEYTDTIRRVERVQADGKLYVGCGVSGGEEGALHGPSIMPGGSNEAWSSVSKILLAISAKASDGTPCCTWIGSGGSGHFVKMVHNGIEYGDMQLISEVYAIMRDVLGLQPDEMADIFEDWNKGVLDSYLIDITKDILRVKENDGFLVDKILDTAGQKGTGKWTSINALNLGSPLTLISEAVFARTLSSNKEERVNASKIFSKEKVNISQDKQEVIYHLKSALFSAKIVSYAQGYTLLKAADEHYGWALDLGGIAMIWRGGCIIRSVFLNNIKDAFEKNPNLPNIMLDEYFKQCMDENHMGLRKIVSLSALSAIPTPALSSALAYFDGYKTEHLPANLIQALRDYFGAHMFERTDKARGEFFHHNWTGTGGTTASSAYNV